MDELLVKELSQVTWVGADGGHKVGTRLDFQHGSRAQVRDIYDGRLLFVPVEKLNPWPDPNNPIPEPTK